MMPELEALSPVCAPSTLSLFKGPLGPVWHGPTQTLKGWSGKGLSVFPLNLTQVHASNRCLGAGSQAPWRAGSGGSWGPRVA